MKKMIIIAMDVDKTAPGVVYGKLLKHLAENFEITLICPDAERVSDSRIKKIEVPPYKRLRYKIETFFNRHLGCNIIDDIWARRTSKTLICGSIKNSDAILSFVSQGHFAPLYLGSKLAKCFNKKWFVYSVDAIPTPLAWNPDKECHRKMSSVLDRLISKADAFFSANPIMLKYELDVLKTFSGYGGVVLTPYDSQSVSNDITPRDGCTFLYTGNVYGARKITTLLAAFKRFHAQQPDSKLIFVGKGFEEARRDYADLVNDSSIEIHGFTNDLTPFYAKSDVLIDIAADVPNDVFLSSKIANYLPYNKPIVAISGENSPARILLGGCDSILHCYHNDQEILDAMIKSDEKKGTEINDRVALLEKFSIENVAMKFADEINININ